MRFQGILKTVGGKVWR